MSSAFEICVNLPAYDSSVAAVTAALATLSTDTGVICFIPAGNGRAFMTAAIGPIAAHSGILDPDPVIRVPVKKNTTSV